MTQQVQKILVVFYSRTGHTRQVAEAIAAALDAELEAIEDVRSRRGIIGWLRSGREAWREQPAEIQPVGKDPSDYDLVVLGTPVWAGRMSSPLRRYIIDQAGRFNRLAAFCTLGGGGGDETLDQVATLCAQTPVARLMVTAGEFKSSAWRDKVAAFATACRGA